MSCEGKGISTDGRGRLRQLMQVLAVGMKEVVTSTNLKLGCSTNPKTGSSSVPVANCKTCAKDITPLLPPAD